MSKIEFDLAEKKTQAELDKFANSNRVYHTYNLKGNLTIPGWYDMDSTVDAINFPDLKGKTMLDIGPASGFYSFYFEKMGAKVTSLEIRDSSQFNKYGISPIGENTQARGVFNTTTFKNLMNLMGSNIEYVTGSVYDINRGVIDGRKFDIVFIGSLLVHLRDPIGALAHAASVSKDLLIATTFISDEKSDSPFMRLARPEKGSIDWWIPNKCCCEHWFYAAGMKKVVIGNRYRQPANTSRPSAVDENKKSDVFLFPIHARV